MSRQEYLCEYVRRKHEEAKPAYEALLSCYPFGLENLDGEEWKQSLHPKSAEKAAG